VRLVLHAKARRHHHTRIAKGLFVTSFLCRLTLGLCASAVISAAFAQATPGGYPNRPIRLIVTVPPGGAADLIARTISSKLAVALNQAVVVENHPGASGTLAAALVAKAPPDGYTLLQNSITTHGIGPHLYPKLSYDPVKDLTPVSMLGQLPLIMTVNANLKIDSLQGFMALARQRPGQLAFASSGNGGAPHMAGELLKSSAGIDILHVPYKGSGPAVADLVGGQVQIMFDGAPSLLAQIQAGKIKPLAAASKRRTLLMPELPTFAELGYAGVDVSLWYGLMAPAGTPDNIINKLNLEINKILQSPDINERFFAQGIEPMPGSPEQAASFIRQESDRWKPIVKKVGVKID
jgi:tripartite-type tricarboxylate transporter receptor subunit TctC